MQQTHAHPQLFLVVKRVCYIAVYIDATTG